MRPPDYRSPSSFPDVPIERGRVGGMAAGAATVESRSGLTVKPYVYRGSGEDVLADLIAEQDRRREEAEREAERRAERLAAQRLAAARRCEADRARAREAKALSEKRAAEQAAYDALPLAKVIPLFPDGPPPPPVSEPQIPATPTQPPRKPRWADHRPKGPTPGWKPLSGADLDDLLDD